MSSYAERLRHLVAGGRPSAIVHAKHLATKGLGGWWEGVVDRRITWIIIAITPSGGWATWFGAFLAARGIPMTEAISMGIATAVPIVMVVAYARTTRSTRRALAELRDIVINRNVALDAKSISAGSPMVGSPMMQTGPDVATQQTQAIESLRRIVEDLRNEIRVGKDLATTDAFDRLTAMQKRILGTLWKYQRIHHPSGFSGRWTFVIDSSLPEYPEFLVSVGGLAKFGYVSVNPENHQWCLTDPAIILMTRLGAEADKLEFFTF